MTAAFCRETIGSVELYRAIFQNNLTLSGSFSEAAIHSCSTELLLLKLQAAGVKLGEKRTLT